MIQVVRDGEFRKDAGLVEEIRELVTPSYVDPSALLARELAHCDTLYARRGDDGRLQTFFLTANERIETPLGPIPTVYLGLSAARADLKNTGVVRSVYVRFLDAAAAWEQATGERLLLWYTTATPSAYHASRLLFTGGEPSLNGEFSEEGAKIALALRRRLGVVDHDHPFVLPEIATNTRYSPAEVARIDRVVTKSGFTLFRRLDIEEKRGDRLLAIARVPPDHLRPENPSHSTT